jgi:hypothetical protein
VNKENAMRLLALGAVVREIQLGRHILYCHDGAYIIHDTRQKRAVNRVVFTNRGEDGAIAKLLELAEAVGEYVKPTEAHEPTKTE